MTARVVLNDGSEVHFNGDFQLDDVLKGGGVAIRSEWRPNPINGPAAAQAVEALRLSGAPGVAWVPGSKVSYLELRG